MKTSIKDLDIKWLNTLNDKDLMNIFQVNKYIYSLYNEDILWMNRVLKYYGKYLGEGVEIKDNYMNDKSWKDYYIYLKTNLHNNDKQEIFYQASELGYDDIVKILLQDERVDPSDYANRAISNASLNGHSEIIKLLLQDDRVNPASSNNYCIQMASLRGHLEVVRLLLQDERVDPSVNNYYAISVISNRYVEISRLLLNHKKLNQSYS